MEGERSKFTEQSFLDQITQHLNIDVREKAMDDILEKYSREKDLGRIQGLHFNKAKIHRYKTEMPKKHIDRINIQFNNELNLMDYEI